MVGARQAEQNLTSTFERKDGEKLPRKSGVVFPKSHCFLPMLQEETE